MCFPDVGRDTKASKEAQKQLDKNHKYRLIFTAITKKAKMDTPKEIPNKNPKTKSRNVCMVTIPQPRTGKTQGRNRNQSP